MYDPPAPPTTMLYPSNRPSSPSRMLTTTHTTCHACPASLTPQSCVATAWRCPCGCTSTSACRGPSAPRRSPPSRPRPPPGQHTNTHTHTHGHTHMNTLRHLDTPHRAALPHTYTPTNTHHPHTNTPKSPSPPSPLQAPAHQRRGAARRLPIGHDLRPRGARAA